MRKLTISAALSMEPALTRQQRLKNQLGNALFALMVLGAIGLGTLWLL